MTIMNYKTLQENLRVIILEINFEHIPIWFCFYLMCFIFYIRLIGKLLVRETFMYPFHYLYIQEDI